MTRVLITGASGFIGSHCLRRLTARRCDVHAVARRVPEEPQPGVVWHSRDLRDPAQAVGIVAEVQPSYLLHCAWIATPRVYAAAPENLDWVRSTAAMAAAFGAHGGRRFVGIGSSAEYCPSDKPCVEDETPIRPASIYGKCKAAAWLTVQAAAQHYGFTAAWGRLFLVYGPGDSPQRLVPSIINALIAGNPIRTTEGLQQRDFIYAPDAGDFFVALLFADQSGAFNVGTGRASTVRSVIQYVAAACGKPELVQLGAIQPAPDDPPVLVADMAKVRAELGWSAPTDIWTGLSRVLALRHASQIDPPGSES